VKRNFSNQREIEMKCNNLVRLIAASYFLCGGNFVLNSVHAAETAKSPVHEFIMSHCDRETSNMHTGYLAAKKFLESTGKFKITLYANASLSSSEADALQQAADNEIQMTQAPVFVLSSASKVNGYLVYDYPYFIETVDNYSKIAASDMAADWAKQVLEKMNVRVGMAWYNGPMTLCTAKKPLNNTKDIVGLKTRSTPSPITVEYFKRLGAMPVSMLTSEVYTALQQGTIEGTYAPIHVLTDFKFDEVCNNFYMDASTSPMQIPVFSNKYYQTLPESDQKLIDEALLIFTKTAKEEAAKMDSASEQYLIKRGSPVVKPTEEEKTYLRGIGKAVREAKADVAGQKYIDWALQILGK
jgi:TRAP-type C4-dicarboxylate transport system substrate-binding protein